MIHLISLSFSLHNNTFRTKESFYDFLFTSLVCKFLNFLMWHKGCAGGIRKKISSFSTKWKCIEYKLVKEVSVGKWVSQKTIGVRWTRRIWNFYFVFFAPFLWECIEKSCAIRIEHEKATSASVEVYFMCTWIHKVSRKVSGQKMLREKWEWCDGFPNGA